MKIGNTTVMASTEEPGRPGSNMTTDRFRSAFRFQRAVFFCLFLAAAAVIALPASAHDLPVQGAAPSSLIDLDGTSGAETGAPSDDYGTTGIVGEGLLDAETRAAADTRARASGKAFGADILRSRTLAEERRIRAAWLARRNPVARVHDGAPRIFARPPPRASQGASRTAGLP